MSFRDALFPELAKETFDRWIALRADGWVPRKDDLCPLGLPPATLPFLMLAERMGEGEEFRCRLVGATIRDWYGANVVGRSMRDLVPPTAYEQRAPLLRHCIVEGAPAWFVGPLLVAGEPYRRAARLLLPVSFRGDAPDGILLVAFIDDRETTYRPVGDTIALESALVCARSELP